MKNHVALPAWFVPLILVVLVSAVLASYFKSQRGRIIMDAEMIGFALLEGGYRSWTLGIADGQILDEKGKLRTVSFKYNREGQIIGYRRGFKWPVYGHTDFRHFSDVYSQPIRSRFIIKTP